MDEQRLCRLCAQCPWGHKRPQTYLEIEGGGYTALACSVVACAYRDLLLCDREDRIAALDWLYSREGEDLLTMIGIELEAALKQAALMFKCGEKRAGLFQRGT
jgi:hypothetical protein